MSGGDVKAITKSKRRIVSSRNEQMSMKLAKFNARRHLLFLPIDSEGMRMMSIPFQCSLRGKRLEGSS